MKDLASHILDIAQNSIRAQAKNIRIKIHDFPSKNQFIISIEDDGKGIAPEYLNKVTDPFFTSRTTRKVGLGLSLLKQNAEHCGGNFQIHSQENKGTIIRAEFQHSHWDRPAIGDIAGTITILLSANPAIDFYFKYQIESAEYLLNTIEIKDLLGEISINQPSVFKFIKEMISENLSELKNT